MVNQANPPERPKRLIESDRVEGTAIYGTEGEHVGTIRRLIIEKISGQVTYVTFSAPLEGGNEEHTVPWGKLKYDTGLGGYRTNITARELREAPGFARDDDDLEWWDRVQEEELHEYYRIPPYWRAI
jgi:hypothetical protein